MKPTIPAYDYLPAEILARLPALYATENVVTQDKILQVKYFTPDGRWTWYAAEYDPEDRLFFGYIQGLDYEWGYFTLTELREARGPLGLRIERDTSFTPTPFKDLRP